MVETTTPRLMAAAKEFNIGKDTLVDFLVEKGFEKDDLNPSSKLTEEMYRALQSEFQSDKVAKLKSDQIDLPKGGIADLKKKIRIWNNVYNNLEHCGLNGKTPNEMLQLLTNTEPTNVCG